MIDNKPVLFEGLSEDDAADPKQGTAAAQKLIDYQVVGVIGHLNSALLFQPRQCIIELKYLKYLLQQHFPNIQNKVLTMLSELWQMMYNSEER